MTTCGEIPMPSALQMNAHENPEVGNTSFQNFEVKLYFNVGIDDKFGFEPETDWVKVIEVLGRF